MRIVRGVEPLPVGAVTLYVMLKSRPLIGPVIVVGVVTKIAEWAMPPPSLIVQPIAAPGMPPSMHLVNSLTPAEKFAARTLPEMVID